MVHPQRSRTETNGEHQAMCRFFEAKRLRPL